MYELLLHLVAIIVYHGVSDRIARGFSALIAVAVSIWGPWEATIGIWLCVLGGTPAQSVYSACAWGAYCSVGFSLFRLVTALLFVILSGGVPGAASGIAIAMLTRPRLAADFSEVDLPWSLVCASMGLAVAWMLMQQESRLQ